MPWAFEWDEKKRARNLAKHGIDFVDAVAVFEGATLSRVDARRDYGEIRLVVIGPAGGPLLTVICTFRDDRCRIISARRANAREKAAYRALRPEEAQEPD